MAPPADKSFRPAVWKQIERLRYAATESWFGYLRRHAVVCALVLVAAVAGAGLLGRMTGDWRARADHDAIIGTYLAQIDARVMQP